MVDEAQINALLDENREMVVNLANGWTLRSGCSTNDFVSGEWVRLCTPDGEEHLYWDNAEWHDDPILVMGAIINSAAVVLEVTNRNEIHTPIMGWQDCRYVFEGNDPEDGDYYRCLTHDPDGERLTLGHEVSCEKATEDGNA